MMPAIAMPAVTMPQAAWLSTRALKGHRTISTFPGNDWSLGVGPTSETTPNHPQSMPKHLGRWQICCQPNAATAFWDARHAAVVIQTNQLQESSSESRQPPRPPSP